MHPLRAVHAAVHKDDLRERVNNFVIDFTYPSAKISKLEPSNLQTIVDYEEKDNALLVSTAAPKLAFSYFDEIETTLCDINKALRPYTDMPDAGALRASNAAEGPLLLPMFQFRIVCKKDDPERLQELFLKLLLDRAARSLILSASIFTHLQENSKPPTFAELSQMIATQEGVFQVNLLSPGVTLPSGWYENRYPHSSKYN